MSTTEAENPPSILSYGVAPARTLIGRSRVFITLFDQALVSVASFFTNFLLLPKAIFGSAQDVKFREELILRIEMHLEKIRFEDQALVLQTRHFELLSAALGNIEQCITLLATDSSPEFLAIELKESLLRIQETLGKRFDDEILDRIFKEFCIGK